MVLLLHDNIGGYQNMTNIQKIEQGENWGPLISHTTGLTRGAVQLRHETGAM